MMMANSTAKSKTEPLPKVVEGKIPRNGSSRRLALRYTHWVNSAVGLALNSNRMNARVRITTASTKKA